MKVILATSTELQSCFPVDFAAAPFSAYLAGDFSDFLGDNFQEMESRMGGQDAETNPF